MAMLDFLLLDVDYVVEDDKPVVRLWGKTNKGETVLVLDRNFMPYFYLEMEGGKVDLEGFKKRIMDLKDIGERLRGLETVEKKVLGNGKKFVRVFLQEPRDLNNLRRIAEKWDYVKKAYEYDIPFYRRYLIDRNITPMGWVSVSGDEFESYPLVQKALEVKNIKPAEGGKERLSAIAIDIEVCGDVIIMISFMGRGFRKVLTHGWKKKGKGKADIEVLKGEKEMLERFVKVINEKDPDIIVTYNGDLFDFHKIRERSDFHKVPMDVGRDGGLIEFTKRGYAYAARIPGRTHIDLYSFVEHILGDSLQSESLTLDMVSRELLGSGKRQLKWKDIEEFWKEKKELKKISSYCLRDSELALRLYDRLFSQISELSRLVGQTLFDTSRMTYSQLVEWLLIRNAYINGEIALNRPHYDEIKRRREASPYTGGYVYQPESGIHENIALFDFASLYPSTVITHNVSPETLDKDPEESKERNSVPDNDHFFSVKRKGFIPRIIESLVRKRMEIKRKMEGLEKNSSKWTDLRNRQYALKIIANASYGYYAYPGSRWYSRICAKSIAAWGRYYIQKVIKLAEGSGFSVIYGDTDSLFLKDCNEKKAEKFLQTVNEQLPETMELELEGAYESGIFVMTKTGTTAKKRYALLGRDGNITIRGFEKVRRDWCKIAKDTQESVLLAVLKEKDMEKALDIVRKVIDRINKRRVKMEDLVIYTQITKPINQYDQIGPHVAAAKKYIERGHTVNPGTVIEYIVTKGSGTISNRAEPLEYAENYDSDYYINHQILPAAMRVLQALGFSEEDILPEIPGQKSLDTFIKKSLKNKLKEQWKIFKKE